MIDVSSSNQCLMLDSMTWQGEIPISEENKAKVRRLFEEAVNQENLSAIDEGVATDCIYHPAPEFNGSDGAKKITTMFRTAFQTW